MPLSATNIWRPIISYLAKKKKRWRNVIIIIIFQNIKCKSLKYYSKTLPSALSALATHESKWTSVNVIFSDFMLMIICIDSIWKLHGVHLFLDSNSVTCPVWHLVVEFKSLLLSGFETNLHKLRLVAFPGFPSANECNMFAWYWFRVRELIAPAQSNCKVFS